MDKQSKIYIAGNTGMVGSAILRNLESKGYTNFVFTPYPKYDLTKQKVVEDFFQRERPEYVINAAAKVGGILANNIYRAQFIYENIMIQSNIIHSAYINNVKKLLFLGSSCIYPKNCAQPMKEKYLLTGLLEPTNEPYAIAKIAGIKMCESYFRQYDCNFISVMPTNLYGPGDNFDLNNSHVIPALIKKFHEAKQTNNPYVEIWGTAKPKREFLYVDDMADACVFILDNIEASELYSSGITHLNIGSGLDLTIKELAMTVGEIIGFDGKIGFNATKPDGMQRKLLDISKLASMGWESKINLKIGLRKAYQWYLTQLT